MALATTTTPGSVILGGDLTGVANAPELRVTGVVAGTYLRPTLVIDAKGRVIFAANGPSGSTTLSGDFTGTLSTAALVASGVSAAAYTRPSFTVNSKGLITSATAGALPPDLIRDPARWGVSGPYTNAVLQTTGVTAGAYTYTTLTVNNYGFITSATSGTAPPAPTNIATYTDAGTPTKGIIQIQSGAYLTVTAGVLSGTVATNSTAGFINSNTPSNISITNGIIDLGANVVLKNQHNIVTAQISEPVLASSSGTITPNFGDKNIHLLTANTITINNPTSLSDGQTGDFIFKRSGITSGNSYFDPINFPVIRVGNTIAYQTQYATVHIHLQLGILFTQLFFPNSGGNATTAGVTYRAGTVLPSYCLARVGSVGSSIMVTDPIDPTVVYQYSGTLSNESTFTSTSLPGSLDTTRPNPILRTDSFSIICNAGSTSAFVYNGSTWSTVTLPFVPAAYGEFAAATVVQGRMSAVSGNTLALIGSPQGTNTFNVYTSVDGTSWTTGVGLGITNIPVSMACIDSSFVATFTGGTSTAMYVSTDTGVNWQSSGIPTYGSLGCISIQDRRFCITGLTQTGGAWLNPQPFLYSNDGFYWVEEATLSTFGDYQRLIVDIVQAGADSNPLVTKYSGELSYITGFGAPTLSFGSSYKFSNTKPTTSTIRLECVANNGVVYCTYNS